MDEERGNGEGKDYTDKRNEVSDRDTMDFFQYST